MRIAVFHDLPSGGAKRSLYECVKRLVAHHSVEVYTLSCADHLFADVRPHVTRHTVFDFQPLPLLSSPLGRLNQLIRLADLARMLRVSRRVAAEIRAGGYDVVFTHPCQFTQSPLIQQYLNGVPIAYFCHEPSRQLYETMSSRPYAAAGATNWRRALDRVDPLPWLYRTVLKGLDRSSTRRASLVLANSAFSRAVLRQVYRVEPRVSPLGVDTALFHPQRVEKEHMVLSVGSLSPLKGFDFLIHALAHISAPRRPALVIASNFQSQPEKAYLARLATARGVQLTLLDNVDDGRLVQLYNCAKLVAYGPIREPFGLVPLESMACGTPVVGVREGGVPETIVHEHTGVLVEREPAQFADAIDRLLNNAALVSSYGRNGREHVLSNWTWERAVATLEGHLASCAGL